MKGKHIQVKEDSELLALLREQVSKQVDENDNFYKRIITAKLLFYGGFSICLYSFLFLSMPSWLFVINYVALGMVLLLFAFNFAHDFSHNAIFKKRKWNSLGFISLYTLVGAHAEAWRDRHVKSHHFAPNVKEYDTDLQITSLIRVTPDMPHRWYHRFQTIYAPIAYATYSLYWIFIKDFKLLFEGISDNEVNGRYILSFLSQKLFYFTYLFIIPLMFVKQDLTVILLGYLLMHLVQSIFLLFTFFMTHHVMETTYPETDENGVIQVSWLMNQIKSSNDMHPFSELANFILGGFNNHIAHHLFPHIHHIHYPQMNRVLYATLIEHGIKPNQTSYIGGVFSHLQLLKKLSVKSGTH